jgi:hypothetical protein
MNTPRKLTKAKLVEIRWNDANEAERVAQGKEVTVQFNPGSLRVTYTNQVQTNDQSNNTTTQYVGRGSSKLNLDLVFDVSMPQGQDPETETPPEETPNDVRKMTEKVAYFITPKEGRGKDRGKYLPPGVRFIWGTFLFDGIVESMDETLEFWSEDGRPLRTTITLGLSQQEIAVRFNPNATPPPQTGAAAPPGTAPLQAARQGDSVQRMASRNGRPNEWKNIAQANGIENPRNLPPGTLLNLRP